LNWNGHQCRAVGMPAPAPDRARGPGAPGEKDSFGKGVSGHGNPWRSRSTILGCLAWSLAASIVTSGCHNSGMVTPGQLPPEYRAPAPHTVQRLNLSSFARTGANSQQIVAGDLLHVAIATGLEKEDKIDWPPIRVSDEGTIDLPLVGMVPVAGLELNMAERRIRDESVRRGIYRAPNVSVTLVKRRMNKVTVVGAVAEPGVKELAANRSDLFAALVAAGGLTDEASTIVEVRRPIEPSPAVAQAGYIDRGSPPPPDVRQQLDLTEMEAAGRTAPVEDGAVVMVMQQPARTVQVIGLVNAPAQIEMPKDREMRMLDAVAQAGGLSLQIANKVHVIRNVSGRNEPVIIRTSIRNAKRSAVANVPLAAGDIVSVEETPLTFTVDTLRSFIRFGFSSTIPGL